MPASEAAAVTIEENAAYTIEEDAHRRPRPRELRRTENGLAREQGSSAVKRLDLHIHHVNARPAHGQARHRHGGGMLYWEIRRAITRFLAS